MGSGAGAGGQGGDPGVQQTERPRQGGGPSLPQVMMMTIMMIILIIMMMILIIMMIILIIMMMIVIIMMIPNSLR